MFNFYSTKESFLRKKPLSVFYVFIIFIIILMPIILFITNIKMYDHYGTKGVIKCDDACYLITSYETLIKPEKIMCGDIDLVNKEISQELIIDEENLVSYYKVKIKLDDSSSEGIVDVDFYYNYESIGKKIQNKL